MDKKIVFLVIVFCYVFFSLKTYARDGSGYLFGSQDYDFEWAAVPWGGGLETPDPYHPDRIFVGKIFSSTVPGSWVTWFCNPNDFSTKKLVGAHWDVSYSGDTMYCNFKTPTYSIAEPPVSTPPTSCSGNPIENSSGAKIQSEIDIEPIGAGGISFQRYFNNTKPIISNPWHFSYERRIAVLGSSQVSQPQLISKSYGSKADACAKGWADIKTGMGENWSTNVTVKLVDSSCQLIRNNVVIKTLPVLTNPYINLASVDGPIHITRDDGSSYVFQKGGAQSYYGLNAAPGNLVWVNTSDVEWRYTTSSNEIEDYSEAGKLLSITATNGIKQTFEYNGPNGSLSQAQDSTGRKLTFSYTNNQLSSVTTDDNKITTYTYNASGLITDVKRPDNTHRLYHYEDARFPTYLTGITDERGVRYATWAYDAQGRAIFSEHAGGAEKTTLAFNTDGSTTVTNALNKKTIYRFDDIVGARRVVNVEGQPTTNCAGANQNYTYTTEGWIASKTDWNGNKTTYTYNTKGQEVSRTEAFGTLVAKTITTEWHTNLNLKTRVTEPDKETIFSYSATGLLLNQKTRSLVAQ